ncbi:MAG: hypothetical protein ACI82I_003491, partial [Gammaproteobacteria bacterium]
HQASVSAQYVEVCPWCVKVANGPKLPLVRNAFNGGSQPKADMAV